MSAAVDRVQGSTVLPLLTLTLDVDMFGFKDTPLVLTMGQCKPDEQKFATLRSWAKVAPLLAALISPITSLMDIPALAVC